MGSIAVVPPYMQEKLCEYLQEKSPELFNSEHLALKKQQSIAAERFAISANMSTKQFNQGKEEVKFSATSLAQGAPIEIWDESKTPPSLMMSSRQKIHNNGINSDVQSCYKVMQEIDNYTREKFKNYVVDNDHLMKVYAYSTHPAAFDNAFWSPSAKAVYFGQSGSGCFDSFMGNPDIITHEFGHAITQFTSNLIYLNQSGALNESFSDVFATIIKNQGKEIREYNWLVADKVLKSGKVVMKDRNGNEIHQFFYDPKNGTALRSMSAPGTAYRNHPAFQTDPQPKHMDEYKITSKDNGGVHLYSGIPNHAFYLAVTASCSLEKIGGIWYRTLSESQPDDDFITFAERTKLLAKQLHGGQIENVIAKAWDDVGVRLVQTQLPNAHLLHVSSTLPNSYKDITNSILKALPQIGVFAAGTVAGIVGNYFFNNNSPEI